MQKNPFVILGVNEDTVTQSELFEAYNNAKKTHLNNRFMPGEVGANACEQLDIIESAYREANEILQAKYYVKEVENPLEEAEKAIRDGQLDRAQAELNKVTNRGAEWHYFQAMVFYKRGWVNDAHMHIKEAVSLDPGNPRYQDTLRSLEQKVSGTAGARSQQQAPGSSFYGDPQQERSYRGTNVDRDQQPAGGCTPCDCCSSLICADCCCECMGGDLIACC